MTFVGHCMTGVAIGLVLIPQHFSRRQLLAGLAGCAVAANLPDLEVPYWGHANYGVSHSIFVNAALILALVGAAALLVRLWGLKVSWKLIAAWAVAWLSHMLLDSFYNHGLGVRIFWPFSNAALVLPIPWFHTINLHKSFWSWYNMSAFLSEFCFYLPFVAGAFLYCLWRRNKYRERKNA